MSTSTQTLHCWQVGSSMPGAPTFRASWVSTTGKDPRKTPFSSSLSWESPWFTSRLVGSTRPHLPRPASSSPGAQTSTASWDTLPTRMTYTGECCLGHHWRFVLWSVREWLKVCSFRYFYHFLCLFFLSFFLSFCSFFVSFFLFVWFFTLLSFLLSSYLPFYSSFFAPLTTLLFPCN